jgi:hypothetical protein
MGVVNGPRLQPNNWQPYIIATVSFALIEMGLQNVFARQLFEDMPATTGIVTILSLFLLDVAEFMNARRKSPARSQG